MYCGNCFRDNALVSELRRQGHEALMVPMYLPMTLDEASVLGETPTFFGGINVFLSQKIALHRQAPAWFRRWFDAPLLLKWAAGKTAKTRPEDVGELTVSMLRGEGGNQHRELEEMVAWMARLPRPDVVFLSNALLIGMARKIRSALGTRVICFLQSEESFLDSLPEPYRSEAWSLMTERVGEVDGWIAPTRYFAERMSARLGLSSGLVRVAASGILLDGYSNLPTPRAVGTPPVLGFFARMCPEKGLDTIVSAFIILSRQGRVPGLRLKVGGGCGPGDIAFVTAQKERLRIAGLEELVSFHPNVSREEKVAFFGSLDVLSVPARFSEAFGLYLVEAMAAGTPVVQPNVCGFAEIISSAGGGFVFEGMTAEALAAALEEVLLNPVRLRAVGEAGRQGVRVRYTDSVMALEVLAATESILSKMGPLPAN